MSAPIALADFWSQLRLLDADLHLDVPGEETETAGGDYLTAVTGTGLWRGYAVLRDLRHREAARIRALLEDIDSGRRPFLAHAWPGCTPAHDNGVGLSGFTPQIASLDADNRRLTISGLPAGYVISAGDLLGWQYGTDPVLHAMHRAQTSVQADGAGLTPLLRLSSPIRPGAIAGLSVQLIRPVIAAVIRAGSLDTGSVAGSYRTGIRFELAQVLG